MNYIFIKKIFRKYLSKTKLLDYPDSDILREGETMVELQPKLFRLFIFCAAPMLTRHGCVIHTRSGQLIMSTLTKIHTEIWDK